MLRSNGTASSLAARSAGWVGFYPCAGARTADAEAALDTGARRSGRASARSQRCAATVTTRDDTCWLHGDGWCLSKRELH